jgi:hypothetical protein
VRTLALVIFLAILGCALLASNARKPFLLRIDAQSPGAWQQEKA